MTTSEVPPTNLNDLKKLAEELANKIAADKEKDISSLKDLIKAGIPKKQVEDISTQMGIEISELYRTEGPGEAIPQENYDETESNLRDQIEEKMGRVKEKKVQAISVGRQLGKTKEQLIVDGFSAADIDEVFNNPVSTEESNNLNNTTIINENKLIGGEENKNEKVEEVKEVAGKAKEKTAEEIEVEKARGVYIKEYLKSKKERKNKIMIEKARASLSNLFTKAENTFWREKKKTKTFNKEDYFTPEFKKAKEVYNQARNEMIKTLLSEKRVELEARGLTGDNLETALIQYKATEIADKLLVDERNMLIDAKVEGAPIRKAAWKRLLDGYMKLPTWKKRVLSIGLFTAAAGTGVIGMGAYAGYGLGTMALVKLGSSVAIGKITSYLVKGIDRLAYFKNKDAKFNENQEGKQEDLAKKFALGEITIEEYDKAADAIHDAERRHNRDRKILKVGTGILVAGLLGSATSYGIGHIHIGTHHVEAATAIPSKPVYGAETSTLAQPDVSHHTDTIEHHAATKTIHHHTNPKSIEAKDIPTGPKVPVDNSSDIKVMSPTQRYYPDNIKGDISPTGQISEHNDINNIPDDAQLKIDTNNAKDIPTGPEDNGITPVSEQSIKVDINHPKDIPTGPVNETPQTPVSTSTVTEQTGIKIDINHPKDIPTGPNPENIRTTNIGNVPDQSILKTSAIENIPTAPKINLEHAQPVGTAEPIPTSNTVTGNPTNNILTNQNEVKVIPPGSINPTGNVYNANVNNTVNYSNAENLRGGPNVVGNNGFTREVPMTNNEQYEYINKTSAPITRSVEQGGVYEVGNHQGAVNIQEDYRHVDTIKDLRKEIGRHDYKHNTIFEKPVDINGNTLKINNVDYKYINRAIDDNFNQNNLKFTSYEAYDKERELQMLFGNNTFDESTRSINVDYFRTIPEWKIVNKIPAKYFFDFENVKEISGAKLIDLPDADLQKLINAKLIVDEPVYINGVSTHNYTFSHQNELFRISSLYEKLDPDTARPVGNETIEQYIGRMTKTVHQTNDGTYFAVSKKVDMENTDGSVVQSEVRSVRNLQRTNYSSQASDIYTNDYSPHYYNLARKVSRVFVRSMSSPVQMFR